MSAAARLALMFVWLLSAAPSFAQDALGGGADFGDEWDAILKIAPPSVAATEVSRRNARGEGRDDPSERATLRGRERNPVRSSNDERAREVTSSDRSDSEQERGARERGKTRAERRAEREQRSEREPSPRERRASKESASRAEKASADRGEAPFDGRLTVTKGDPREASKDGYAGLVHSWHEPWPAQPGDQAVNMLAGAPPVLSIHPVGNKGTTPYVLLPNGEDGGFNEAQIAVASQAFGHYPGGPQVSARLLDLIYHAAKHFNVFHVHLVSGIRNDRSGSRHSHGLAADIVLPGVSDEELAAYFRPQGFLGVGVYTRAGFVHVDVREKSYFWLDKSPPGRRMRIIPVRAEEARLADEAAVNRGQTGYVNPPRLQKALYARAKRRLEKARASQ